MVPVLLFLRQSVASLLLVFALTGTSFADEAFFEKKIRPALVKHCYRCHSAEAAKSGELGGGLQLDTKTGIRRGGDSGAAVVPKRPAQSLLLAAMRHEDGLEMPPDADPLPDSVIADFQKWIEEGAADPRDGKPVSTGIDIEKAREFWSLKPLESPELPSVKNDKWPRTEIDRFVLSRLEQQNLSPVGDVTRRVLLRRLFFDLIGLPPTTEELKKFEAGSIEDAVDYLLASPHFGERWGRHWLDVARYAESNGRARNMAWHNAWRYRDWVIDALNEDLPYDQFVAQQIAGDLLPANNDEQRDQQTIATGFLALGPKSLEERNRELFRMDLVDEQIDVISRGILGLSVSCARCHDHKFDPVPTADYYSLAGILLSTDTLYGIGPMGIKGVNDADLAPIGADAEKLAEPASKHLKSVQEKTQERNTARSDRYRVVRKVADRKRQLGKGGVDQEALKKEISDMEAEIKEWDEKIKKMDEDLAALVASSPPQPQFAMAARDSVTPEDCRIRIRGEAGTHGEAVPRGVLQVIPISSVPAIQKEQSGRLQLAAWLSSKDNPLTARVFVNRVWQHLFGRGLVDTPDDFGATGSTPSHPELLDFLAARFMQQGWSTKKLIREIVLSRTYQLASEPSSRGPEVDPDNVYLWHMPVRRLEVEPFRDALLSVSGRLNRERRAGSPIQQIGVFSDYEFNFKTKLTPEMIRTDHRSVYLPVVRGALPEMLQLFDFADPNALTGERDQTTVPSQALFLMNSPAMIEFAELTADRILKLEADNDEQKLDWLYQVALSRKPTDNEVRQLKDFLQSESSSSEDKNDDQVRQAWISICQSILSSSEFRHIR